MFDPNDPKLTAYVLGELDGEECQAIETELKESADLRRAVDEIRQTTDLLTGTLEGEPCPRLTSAQQESIKQQSTQGDSGTQANNTHHDLPTDRRQKKQRIWAIAIAVSLLVGLLAYSSVVIVSPNASRFAAQQRNMDIESSATEPQIEDADLTGLPLSNDETFDHVKGTGISAQAPASVDSSTWHENSIDSRIENQLRPRVPSTGTGDDGTKYSAGQKLLMEFGSYTPKGASGNNSTVRGVPAPVADPRAFRPEGSTRTGPGRGVGYQPARTALPAGTTAAGSSGASGENKPSDKSAENPGEGRPRGKGKPEGEGQGKTGDNGQPAAKRTWRRVKAIPNTSRLFVGDRDELPMEGLQVNVVVDGFRARVLLDCYFYNNRSQRLEGTFKLRLPNDASLYYFAFGETAFEYRPMVDQLASNGFLPSDVVRSSGTGPAEIMKARSETWNRVKEARVVPREKAAHAYSETVRRRVDPALVEWSGAGVFNARVFPLMPNKLHRIVIGYDVNLQQDGDDLVYKLDLPAQVEQRMLDLNIAALPGASVEVAPETKPFTSAGRAYYHFKDPHENTIDVRFKNPGSVLIRGADGQTGDYFATRITPDLPAGEGNVGSTHAIFLVDTSLSSNPDKFNVWLDMLEATLNKNRDKMKQFAVLFFNIESHWWEKKFVDNTPDNVRKLITYCNTLSLEGATDLRQALLEAASPVWMPDGELPFAGKPDMFLLSDGAVTWGEMNLHLVASALKRGWGGTLFAYKTGMTGTAIGVLEHLARESGGAVFSVVNQDEVEKAATAHRSRPWQLLNATVAGGSDLLTAGRIRSIYPGQSLLLVGRGKAGAEAVLKLRRGDETKTINVQLDRVVNSDLTARMYGQVAVGQLEDLMSATEKVSAAYARHFRVTGQTCSLLMLESEADYQRFNIKPEDDLSVVKISPVANLIARKIDELGQTLQDPKASMVAWLDKMENTPGFEFKIPTLLQLALDQLPAKSFDVEIPRLVCKLRSRNDLPKKFFQTLQEPRLDYDLVSEESRRRHDKFGGADALKTLSSLVENNPGDPVLTRDVAFSAMEWGLGGQAYPLLKRVAAARPFEPQIYQAMAQCLADLGHADLAIVYYEVALHGQWHSRYKDFHRIASVEYLHLLGRIDSGQLSSSIPDYAKARMETLANNLRIGKPDLIITMMWNTDRTDVDLHVREPSGEECSYKNPNTRTGGRITADVTEGFGPEMYTLSQAQNGKYVIKANYYGSDANRTEIRSKIHVTIYEGFGTKQERVTKKTVTLSRSKEMRELATVSIQK